MAIHFTKMHGLGNDFVVIDAVHQNVALNSSQLRQLADRHLGVGCDQILLVEPPAKQDVLFNYRIFNADGGEVEQCGNGARCFARFVREKNLTDASVIPVQTNSGRIELQVEDNGEVTVNMGVPVLEPERIPFRASRRQPLYTLKLADRSIEIAAVSIGNPHAVMRVDDVATAPVELLGPQIESHPDFPRRVNAGFMQVVDQNMIKLRVYERGVGETQACGTGACAAVVAGRLWQLLDEKVYVQLTGGTLTISWQGEGRPVMMTGPAQTVYEGSIDL